MVNYIRMKKGSHRHIRGVRILFEDADVIVVEKAAGVLSQATTIGQVPSAITVTFTTALGPCI
jgi:23S rRNA-/tRNA-specific pseudouridylate synthase